MKLLFDENLSPRLARGLAELYPGSAHLRSVGLGAATDIAIWEFAGREGFTLVSKDNDFRQLAFLRGAPPKVIWLCVGNAGTGRIMELLLSAAGSLSTFAADGEASLLVLELDGV